MKEDSKLRQGEKSRRSMLKFLGLTPLAILASSTNLVEQPVNASIQPNVVNSASNTFSVTTAPLSANQTYNTGALDCQNADEFGVNVYADQSGTLNVETSVDSTNWRLVDVVPIVGSVPINRIYAVTTRYMRLRYVNGGTGQTIFELGATQR